MTGEVAQRSRELFEAGYYCAESVLLAIAEAQGIRSDWIPRIATGFCGGMSRTCGMCGAVSGAIMGLGLVQGRGSPQESEEETYASVRKLLGMFEERFGTTNCRELVGCDLGTEEGQRFFLEHNVAEKCARYTEEAARMAATLIEI